MQESLIILKERLRISILVPCHNEEKSIRKCIESFFNQTRKPDEIIVVNDGSTDNSKKILDEFNGKINVISLKRCTGNKSRAQELGLKMVTGDIFISTDADTILDEHFVEKIEEAFKDKNVAAACGYVKSLKFNWLTACREIDYVIGQAVHKLAQSYMNFLVVIPGCAAAFRTKIFREHITFDHDTVAEDLDFTYKLNRLGLNINFAKKAVVYTQDPADLGSYINQMRRWYRGNCQNLVKHYKILNRPISALELLLIYFEAILLPLVLIILPLLSVIYFSKILIIFIAASFFLTLFASIYSQRIDLLAYMFHYLFIMFINSFIFIQEFIKEVILRKKKLIWLKPNRREII